MPEPIERAAIRAMMDEIPTPTAGDIRGIIGFTSYELADLTLIARALNNDRRDKGYNDDCEGR